MATITVPRTFGGTLIIDIPIVQIVIMPNILLSVRKGTAALPVRKGTIVMKVREQ